MCVARPARIVYNPPMDNSCYSEFGAYIPSEAHELIDAFIKENVRFEIERDDTLLKGISAVAAHRGGTYGHGVRITIDVHKDDWDTACRLRQELFGY